MLRHFKRVAADMNVEAALKEIWRHGAEDAEIDRLHCPDRDAAAVIHLFQHPAIAEVGVMNARYAAAHALLDEVSAALGDMDIYLAAFRILLPWCEVGNHRDGFVPEGRKRYHLALQTDHGAEFVIDGERCGYKPGELWHVGLLNRPHSAVNNSSRARVIMLVDAYEAGAFDAAEVRRLQDQYRAVIGPDWKQALQSQAR